MAALCVAVVSQGAIIEFKLGPVDATGAGMHPANATGNVSSGGSGGELNTRNPLLGGITFDTVSRTLEINVGWGTDYGFTDLAGNPTLLEVGGPTSVPRAEANSIYFFYSDHPGFVGESTKDGYFSTSLALQDNPGSMTYSAAEQATDLMNGLWYLNLRTSAYLGGEIRGQLAVVPEPAHWGMMSGLLLLGLAVFHRTRRPSALRKIH